ncbi:extracellular sulfatase Sulf-1-like [Saccoglossus kowalevskii]
MQLPWLFSLLAPLLYFVTVIDAAPERNRNKPSYSSNLRENKQSNKAKNKSSKPNIILIMTDDQDLMLGSMDAMNKTRHILGEGGATFNNAFVTTPMCCPSRSTILTGLHTHNHNVYTNNEHCGSLSWRRGPETKTFATFLKDNTYRTGYFGKYLNTYNGTYIPPGWMEWVGLVHNSRFYNYTINRNGKKIRMKNDYYKDYLTDLIANDSVTFFKLSKQVYPTRPVAIVLSMPAPHGPEDAAPQYQHMFSGVMTHRTPTWNIAPNHDKHWIFQYTTKMEPQQIAFTDILQQKRLQTLLSVDDAVEKSYNMLKEMDELDNTFIIFTSDHGYHAGQFGLVKGKSMPYDFDIRVPFYIRGPNIPPGIQIPNIILNVDIAPTILDMAGIPIPQEMDGKSVLKLLFNGTRGRSGDKKKRQWRDTFLVERGKPIEERERSNYLPRNERMKEECAKPEYQSPCQPEQLKECVMNEDGTLRFKKCRNEKKSRKKRKKCRCNNSSRKLGKKEKKSQRLFIREHISQDDYKPRFMRSRNVRDTEADLDDPFSFQLPDNKALSDGSVRNAVVDPKCQIYPNRTVMCDNMVSSSKEAWNEHSQFVSMQIKELREKIKDLKDIHNYLRKAKPPKRKYCICKSGDLELDEEDLEESDEDDDDSSIVESATVYSTGEKK